MQLQINGEMVTVPESVQHISDLIEHFKLEKRVLMIEHNESILEKDHHPKTELKDGDKIEIVQFVGGG
ncbi:sulfur carrier protein ThiS [Bacillus sp. Marseille-Q3570]|uniref:sulfur carrier protein ThiS n=1 Tax=Bacillus sp. Marseille-Q3570 TaxID=2963522 RepID=UPI0021B83199|nr:sulfur carrier protein ThiS [Bacillus sp. Marseille-Q3570]